MRVALLKPPRQSAGGNCRLDTWRRLCDVGGFELIEVKPSAPTLQSVAKQAPSALCRDAVVETLAWDVDKTVQGLKGIAPDVVVVQTLRGFSPELLGGSWRTVVDLVDRLSLSYSQRRRGLSDDGVASFGLRCAYGLLEASHGRVERDVRELHRRGQLVAVVAGHSAHLDLGMRWLPNLAPFFGDRSSASDVEGRQFDAVFWGSLRYAPNIEALELLAECDGVERISVLVGGSNPSQRVMDLCDRMGWTLEADFESLEGLVDRAKVAVAPLVSAAGIQNKVLEGWALGVPVVATSAALRGFRPGHPAVSCDDPSRFVREVERLAVDAPYRRDVVANGLDHARISYAEISWLAEVDRTFGVDVESSLTPSNLF